MCEANAYLLEEETPRLIMESVDTLTPDENGVTLVNIFGEQKFLAAAVHKLELVDHKIILKPLKTA
ncbi:MAG: RNA-binding protein [Desulfobacterales bacterium]|nr:MAG: RNA-binding protein [Desulfobacterales bacterium]